MKLWRAAHNSRVFRGACFAQDRRDAEAYLDNPRLRRAAPLSASRSTRRDVLDCTGRDALAPPRRRLRPRRRRLTTLDELRSLCWDRAAERAAATQTESRHGRTSSPTAGPARWSIHVLEDQAGVLACSGCSPL
ncbi:MAG: hypothetical protein KatS3mg038_1614 [Candidatus Kapaibacterium sp.]|nr:MAG: hypothetical protein KatS3mg038_1614 [Candidatus Kapabacteria bacterium]